MPTRYEKLCAEQGLKLCDQCPQKEQPDCSGGRPVHAEAVGNIQLSDPRGVFEKTLSLLTSSLLGSKKADNS